MSAYASLARSVIYPIGAKVSGSYLLEHLKSLKQTQWMSKTDLQNRQDKLLKFIINYSYKNIPYYHEIMKKCELKPSDITTTKDLVKLPLIAKNEFRDNFPKNMVSKGFDTNNLIPSASSGSTGEPLQFYRSKNLRDWEWASKFRSWEWGGYHLGEKYVTLMGNPMKAFKQSDKGSRATNKMLRNLFLPSFDLNEGNAHEYIKEISKYGPVMIRGYASPIHFLSKYMANTHKKHKIAAVFPTGETLSKEARKDIEAGYNCPVFDTYGSEGNVQAFECEEYSGYHIASEGVIVEFLDHNQEPVGPGERGEIVITSLLNQINPFLRYRVGDFGVPSDEVCNCGRGLPLIKKLEGRLTDYFVTSDGRLIVPYFFTRLFKTVPGIKQFQVVQESLNEVIIKVVTDKVVEDELNEVKSTISKYLGEETNIDLNVVDWIPVEKSGKRRFVVSKVKRNHWHSFVD